MMRRTQRESRQPEDEPRPKTKPPPPAHAPPPLSPASAHPKTRCYRLNLEKPFDAASANPASPVRHRDYSGPLTEADLPPVKGPAEYYPPPHLLRGDEIRRHSWGGAGSGMGAADLMANLQVSESSDDNNETSVAISTARIFRGITVDRNGVILTQNARATRSKKDNKNKVGEKSRQAAKIDKAKDLIDDVLMEGNEENDPTKIVSLYVMGEYDELDDLVRDGSKKLRESKSLSDEALLSYNRPRAPPGYILSPRESHSQLSHGTGGATSTGRSIPSAAEAMQDSPSPANRKRLLGSRYKNPAARGLPKLKSHPRDVGRSNRKKDAPPSSGSDAKAQHHHQNAAHDPGQPHGAAQPRSASHPQSHHAGAQPHYFREQCNFFPGPHSNWAEALGFSVNSLWNCGAAGGHMSPASRSVSPRSSGRYGGGNGGSDRYGSGGGNGGNDGEGGGYGYRYHYGYEERDPHGGGGGYEEYGRSRGGGVRDTVVM